MQPSFLGSKYKKYSPIINSGAVASFTDYTHHEKSTLVVLSVSVVSLRMVEDAIALRLIENLLMKIITSILYHITDNAFR